jgi:hypothetical protein
MTRRALILNDVADVVASIDDITSIAHRLIDFLISIGAIAPI